VVALVLIVLASIGVKLGGIPNGSNYFLLLIHTGPVYTPQSSLPTLTFFFNTSFLFNQVIIT
jgi:hypothetical protein